MTRSGLAVLGTGTGVGKTVVTAGVVGRLRERGRAAVAIKPVQTGYPPDDDAGVVQDACGTESAGVCLRRLEPPLAPAVAAEEEGVELSYDELLDDCERELAAADPGVVEGVGGLRVPLADDREVVDLVADLDLSALVVARSGLGTLNHSALTVEALDRRGVDVLAVVLNDYAGATLAERTNPRALDAMVDPPVYRLPELALERPADAVTAVRDHLPVGPLADG
ncbi:dethiobiotin synthase [halophilic archaeon]|nr:dethiobiotin synthase [halophilic archaeon]